MTRTGSSVSGFLFDLTNYCFLILLCVCTLFPFLHLVTLSVSPSHVSFTEIHFFPREITFANFAKVFDNEYIRSGFVNTITRTVLGTAVSLLATIFTAYVLSKKYYPHRTFWTAFIVFTMFFSGGLIPSYLLVKTLGLMNSVWALILPGLISAFSMIIARNFFMSLPEELEESAKIDGANDIVILFRIVIPISMPIIATLLLWIAVGHWNAWFDSLVYMTDAHKHVLMVVMRRIVLEGTNQMMEMTGGADDVSVNPESVKAAVVMVTTLPILVLYPFVQKYFVKGILVGSLKG
jgi:putative aldouronate transport system permease protein